MSKKIIWKFVIILAICVCLIVIIILMAMPKGKVVDGIQIVETKKEESEKITKQEAIQVTIEQFKNLGENVTESNLTVQEIEQNGEKYFYIRSAENSIHIQINGGKIRRINNINI